MGHKIFRAPVAISGARNAEIADTVQLSAGTATSNIAAIAPSSSLYDTSGIAVMVVVAKDTADPSKMAVWRRSQAWYANSGSPTLVGSITSDATAIDTDGAFVAPTFLVASGKVTAHVTAHGTRTCLFAVFHAAGEVGK